MDVLTAAWVGAGSPEVAQGPGRGSCARCGQDRQLKATRAVVSKNFTGFDRWSDPRGGGLCSVCAWGYTAEGLREHPHLVLSGGTLRRLSGAALHTLLGRPLNCGQAIIVPLRAGRQHLVPEALWGRVTMDHAALTWTGRDVERLAAVQRLLEAGFGSRMLEEPAPAYGVIRRLERTELEQVLADWAVVEPWRRRPLWLGVAVRAELLRSEAAGPNHAAAGRAA